jgi:hypothetical protein
MRLPVGRPLAGSRGTTPKIFGCTTGCGTTIGAIVSRSELPARLVPAKHGTVIAAKTIAFDIARKAQSLMVFSVVNREGIYRRSRPAH